MSKTISGVYAALGTPRKQNGSLDKYSLQKSIEFLLEKSIKGFAINGATGEYCINTNAELKQILKTSTAIFDENINFVVGIGSAGIYACLEKGKLAIDNGANAILLPPPHYFPYAQDECCCLMRQVKICVKTPISQQG